jgi:hypothetical protein
MTKKIGFLILMASLNSHANDWTNTQKLQEEVFLTLIACDWYQTREAQANNKTICDNKGNCTTTNQEDLSPILGKHPSNSKIATDMILGSALHYLVADYLPTDTRSLFLSGTIAFEFAIVAHNYSIGLKLGF